jgi:hypothetical protein
MFARIKPLLLPMLLCLGVIGFTLGLGYVLMPRRPAIQRVPYENQNPAFVPGGMSCLPSSIAKLKPDKRQAARADCDQAEEQHRLDANALLQEVRSAKSSEEAAFVSWQQALLLLMQTMMGALTFFAAGAAVWYAKKAAWEARRGASAAELSLTHARETSQAELRAYLVTATKLAVPVDPTNLVVEFLLRNAGHTPAEDVIVHLKMHYLRSSSTANTAVELKDQKSRFGSIPPQGETRSVFTMDKQLTATQIKALKSSRAGIIMRITIPFIDAFGVCWVHSHRFSIDDATLATGDIHTINSETAKVAFGNPPPSPPAPPAPRTPPALP